MTGRVTAVCDIPDRAVETGQPRFTNTAAPPARLLCMCTPAGQEEFFAEIGDPVPGRISPAPELDPDTKAERMKKALALAPRYRTELLLQ